MSDKKITRGSGNVFADLGLPDAEEMLVKSTLAHEIDRLRVVGETQQRRPGKQRSEP